MKSIQFRAWNAANNSFLDLTGGEWGYYFISPNGKFMVHYYGLHGNPQETKELNYIILQQNTGLKDSNGKDIYEGDIIEMDELDLDAIRKRINDNEEGNGFPKKRIRRTIIFADGAFGFKGTVSECVRQSQFDCNYNKFVVVGNVFE